MGSSFLCAALLGVALVPAVSSAATIYIDFNSKAGDANTATGGSPFWNVTDSSTVSMAFTDLKTDTGASTFISMDVTDDFVDDNSNTNTGSWTADVPWAIDEVTKDFFNLQDSTNSTGEVVFGGLDPTATYTFDIVASRSAAVGTSQRRGEYRINGALSDDGESDDFNALTNSTNHVLLTWADVVPNEDNEIVVDVTALNKSVNNDFAYLNGMRITTAVPEPASAALAGLAFMGLGLRRRRV